MSREHKQCESYRTKIFIMPGLHTSKETIKEESGGKKEESGK